MQPIQLRFVAVGGAIALAVACTGGSVSRAHHGADAAVDAVCDAPADAARDAGSSGSGSNHGSGSGSSCGGSGSGSGSSSGSGSGSSINACDNGSDACGSNAQCRSCLDEGACAEGPDPVWTGTECVCADTPEHCQLTFCCIIGDVWNPTACTCVPAS